MIITIELPDDTLAGYINFVYGTGNTMNMSALALCPEDISNRKATYKTDQTNNEEEGALRE